MENINYSSVLDHSVVGLKFNTHFLISYHRPFEGTCVPPLCQAPLVKKTDMIAIFIELPGHVEEIEILFFKFIFIF